MEKKNILANFSTRTQIVAGIAVMTMATYLVLTKYKGKEYLIEKLKQRDEALRLEQRCTQIRKKIESMFKQSPNIFHPQNDLFILTQFSIDFVIS